MKKTTIGAMTKRITVRVSDADYGLIQQAAGRSAGKLGSGFKAADAIRSALMRWANGVNSQPLPLYRENDRIVPELEL